MTKPTLAFWYEFGSTYTYLSVTRIDALAEAVGVTLEWKPFLLMPVLKHLGVDNPFTTNAAKCAYMWTDLMRRAEALEIPIKRAVGLSAKLARERPHRASSGSTRAGALHSQRKRSANIG